ncbi:unnamed protein product [Rhizophagus irregularis]|nr:unnamed protein product [Rhizophagus irregularis]
MHQIASCIMKLNRTWCVTAVPILWRNPDQFCGMDNLITETTYHRPLFNYMSFWKYLILHILEDIISLKMIEKSNASILRNEILKLFINKNTKLIQLSIPRYFDSQLHLIPEAECCLSELEIFNCDIKLE